MPPPLPLAPTLPDELLEEIFLRLPPDEPEWLVRASLASKVWLGRLTAPRFRGLYCEFHRAPPMLGFFLSNQHRVLSEEDQLFVSTTKFRACIPDPEKIGYSAYEAMDCRHGRVLLGPRDFSVSPKAFVVLDPITGCRRELGAPGSHNCYAGAVLCAVKGCDHHACHDGPSRVVCVGLHVDPEIHIDDGEEGEYAFVYESLPETGDSCLPQWGKPCSGLYLGPGVEIQLVPPVRIQDTLYFKLVCEDDDHVGILKYDMHSKCLSLIDVPLAVEYNVTILMGMEDGSLGFAHLDGLSLNMWSWQIDSDGVGLWSECRVIDLKELLPTPNIRLELIGSVEGGDIIFVTTELGIYEINLKSLEWKKIRKKKTFCNLIPYMRFYYPQAPEIERRSRVGLGAFAAMEAEVEKARKIAAEATARAQAAEEKVSQMQGHMTRQQTLLQAIMAKMSADPSLPPLPPLPPLAPLLLEENRSAGSRTPADGGDGGNGRDGAASPSSAPSTSNMAE